MGKPDKERLIARALEARRYAVAPFSRFAVGAALLTPDGEIITGANIESASFSLTCCAERVALFKGLSEGKRRFVALAVVAEVSGGPMPCGACRQLLAEYAPNALVWLSDCRDPSQVREYMVAALLPEPFKSF